MFALCGNRTRDLLRKWRVFPPLRQIGRQKVILHQLKFYKRSIIHQFINDTERQGKNTDSGAEDVSRRSV
jgi:hypothetical protein